MAPIKFEEHIKEKLDKREIQPSNLAWDKIAASLENSSQKKKRGFLWYAIAASIIGLLLASLFLFIGQDDVLDKSNPIVDKDKDEINSKNVEPSTILNDVKIESIDVVKTNESNKVIEEKSNQKESAAIDFALVSNEQENKKTQMIMADTSSEEALINSKIYDLIAQVDSLELTNKATVTDAEIDLLLRKAQNEILEQRIFKNNNVDALALLAEAEDELNVSIRDQLFETLKNGYLKVRTAVADRNN